MQIAWDPVAAFDIANDDIFPMVAAGGDKISDVVLSSDVKADLMLKMVPLQVHWHVTSEHSVGGMLVRTAASYLSPLFLAAHPATIRCSNHDMFYVETSSAFSEGACACWCV